MLVVDTDCQQPQVHWYNSTAGVPAVVTRVVSEADPTGAARAGGDACGTGDGASNSVSAPHSSQLVTTAFSASKSMHCRASTSEDGDAAGCMSEDVREAEVAQARPATASSAHDGDAMHGGRFMASTGA